MALKNTPHIYKIRLMNVEGIGWMYEEVSMRRVCWVGLSISERGRHSVLS